MQTNLGMRIMGNRPSCLSGVSSKGSSNNVGASGMSSISFS